MSVKKVEKPGYHYAKAGDTGAEVRKSTVGERIGAAICIILCIILIPILAAILTLEVKSVLHPDRAASILGYVPIVVESEDMTMAGGETCFSTNDLLLMREIKPINVRNKDVVMNENGNRPAYDANGKYILYVGADELQGDDIVLDYGDIVACLERDADGNAVLDSSNNPTYVIRKIYEIRFDTNGNLFFRTGDLSGNLEDGYVYVNDVVALYNTKRAQDSGWTIDSAKYMYDGVKIPKVGVVFTWFASPIGMGAIAAVSLLIIILIFVFSRKPKNRK